MNDLDRINEKIIEIEEVLRDFPKIILEEKRLKLFLNGVKLKEENVDGFYRIYSKAKVFIGTGIINKCKLKRDVVL